MCTKHPHEEITRVCDDCGVLVCSMGISLSHSNHTISSLLDGVTRERSKLKQSLLAAQKLVDRVQPKVEVVKQRVTGNRETTTRLHEQVETDITRLVEAITRRGAAAHEEIESRAEAVLRPMEAEKTSMEDWLSRTGSCMEMSSRALVVDCAVPVFTECQVNNRWLGQSLPLHYIFTVYR